MNRRGFLSAIGAIGFQAIPLGRVWSFPSKIVIPPPKVWPRLFLSKDDRDFTEIPGLSGIEYRPALVDDVTNLDAAGIFRKFNLASLRKDSITFEGQGIGGFIAGFYFDELRRFRVELSEDVACEGAIRICEVTHSEVDYKIKGDVISVEEDELLYGSLDPTVIARERQVRGVINQIGGRYPIMLPS